MDGEEGDPAVEPALQKTELNPVERWSLPGIASQTEGLATVSTQEDSPSEMQYQKERAGALGAELISCSQTCHVLSRAHRGCEQECPDQIKQFWELACCLHPS